MRVVPSVLGQFLLCCALILVILANMGQLTHNMVSRNIRLMDVHFAQGSIPQEAMASSMTAPIGQQNGVRAAYLWGMYNYCGGSDDYEKLACAEKGFGHSINVPDAVTKDVPQANSDVAQSLGSYSNQSSINRYTKAGFYLLFVGTILTGVAFIVSLLFVAPVMSLATILTFLAFAVLVCGAVMETYFISKMKSSPAGVIVHYGNALWMFWAAIGCTLFAIPILSTAAVPRTGYRTM